MSDVFMSDIIVTTFLWVIVLVNYIIIYYRASGKANAIDAFEKGIESGTNQDAPISKWVGWKVAC